MRFPLTAHLLALVLRILPVAVGAGPAARVPRIGILTLAPTATASPSYDALREALRELGYVEGKSIVLGFGLPRETTSGCRHWPPTWSACRSMSS